MKARRAEIKIQYKGVNITKDLMPYLLNFSYTDNESKADEIQVDLQDKEAKWHGPWLPNKDDEIVAAINVFNWSKPGDNRVLNCGKFFVDEVDFKGPPDTFTIKAISYPIKAGGKNTKRTKAWSSAKLSVVCADLATSAGLGFIFDGKDVFLDRVEQVQQTDLSFAKELNRKYGNSIKVQDGNLVVYNEKKYESSPAIKKIVKTGGKVLNYSFKEQMHDAGYKEIEVKYYDSEKKEIVAHVYNVPGITTGTKYTVNERAKSLADAEEIAIATARKKNKKVLTADITVVGDPSFLQGYTVDVVGWQKFDGKYFIENASHSVGNGYTVKLKLRGVLPY